LESKLRKGDYAGVRDFLRTTSRNEIPDRLILRVSQLARRIDYAKKGLMLLRDRVLDLPSGERADPHEQAEYAACLIKLGATLEARKLLQNLLQNLSQNLSQSSQQEEAQEPMATALKYFAFTFVHEWDYESVVPLLTKYLSLAGITSYDRMVGTLNLAAALIAIERFNEAVDVLLPLRAQAESEGFKLVLGNSCELLAQTQIHLGQFAKADDYLSSAWDALHLAQPRYKLYLEKWRAIARLVQAPRDPLALSQLRRVRREAIAASEWEIIRECDFYESLHVFDEAMFLHLYFGTPYASYRAKMLKKSERPIVIPETYVWGGRKTQPVLDLGSGLDGEGRMIVKKGQALLRLAKALTFDFYAPAPVAQIFSQVFKDECFLSETSAERIYELVRRLKAQMLGAGMEISVTALERGYKLDVVNSSCGFIVANEQTIGSLQSDIQRHFGGSEFRLRQLVEKVSIPHTTLYREIKRLIEAGILETRDKGKHTRYVLSPSQIEIRRIS
jgi:tetratricopeptide (TPR) repeat protein